MDFHFLVRNGIAGGIFLALLIVGVWVANPEDVVKLLESMASAQSLIVAAVAAATPVIGICLQSLFLIGRYARGNVFTDEARIIVANRLRVAVKSDASWDEQYSRFLEGDMDDRLFVSLYHRKAPQHLIEWARRRRSYYYLGWTSVLGAVLGFLSGLAGELLWQLSFWHETFFRSLIAGAALACWILAAAYLAKRMKRDADFMELAWAIFELTPELQKRIEAPAKDAAAPRHTPNMQVLGAFLAGVLAGRSTSREREPAVPAGRQRRRSLSPARGTPAPR